jgi:hypothetical protein
MKKLINKFKSQPLPVKLLAISFLAWGYPLIETMVYGATGWSDLSTVAIILTSIGMIPIGYMFIFFFLLPVGGWILWKLGIIKKKKKK